MNNTSQPPKLLDQMRETIRRRHMSISTERSYVQHVTKYILFHRNRQGQFIHPRDLGTNDIRDYLSHLAIQQKVSAVFSRPEALQILSHLTGTHKLMGSLLYGTGMRLLECLRLRVKDIDFVYKQITIHDGKGEKDRVTMIPESLVQPLGHSAEIINGQAS